MALTDLPRECFEHIALHLHDEDLARLAAVNKAMAHTARAAADKRRGDRGKYIQEVSRTMPTLARFMANLDTMIAMERERPRHV